MIIAARLIPVDVILRFMSHIVDRKTENYRKLFIIKIHQNLKRKWKKKKGQFRNGAFLFACSIYFSMTMKQDSNVPQLDAETECSIA